jgi:hypothetical protein
MIFSTSARPFQTHKRATYTEIQDGHKGPVLPLVQINFIFKLFF